MTIKTAFFFFFLFFFVTSEKTTTILYEDDFQIVTFNGSIPSDCFYNNSMIKMVHSYNSEEFDKEEIEVKFSLKRKFSFDDATKLVGYIENEEEKNFFCSGILSHEDYLNYENFQSDYSYSQEFIFVVPAIKSMPPNSSVLFGLIKRTFDLGIGFKISHKENDLLIEIMFPPENFEINLSEEIQNIILPLSKFQNNGSLFKITINRNAILYEVYVESEETDNGYFREFYSKVKSVQSLEDPNLLIFSILDIVKVPEDNLNKEYWKDQKEIEVFSFSSIAVVENKYEGLLGELMNSSLFLGFLVVVIFGLPCICCLLIFCICCCCCCCIFKKKKKDQSFQNHQTAKELSPIDKFEQETANSNVLNMKINQKLFEIDGNSVKLVASIGEGGGGANLFKAVWENTNVAYKVFNKFGGNTNFESIEREISLLGSLSHPNIIKFYGASIDKTGRIGILMEFADNGDIGTFMINEIEKNGKIEFSKKLELLRDALNGIRYLHSKNIIHRDIKPENILVTKNNVAKIIDFGISRAFENLENESMKTKRVGTAYFMAPDVLTGKYDSSIDCFSFAIMMWCVAICNFKPYFDKTNKNGYSRTIELKVANDENFRPSILSDFEELEIPKWYIDLMKKNWSSDSSERNTSKELFDIFNEKIKKNSQC